MPEGRLLDGERDDGAFDFFGDPVLEHRLHAVDVAKSAADMILLERDLRVLHASVLEGRRTFGNIMKYIMMGTSSNFGNMFSMAGASLFFPSFPCCRRRSCSTTSSTTFPKSRSRWTEVDDDYLSHPRHWDMNLSAISC